MPDRLGNGGLRPPSRRQLVLSANRFIHNQQLILLLLAVVAGSAAAFGAIVFREVVILGQIATFGGSLEGLSNLVRNLPEWQIVAVPTLGGLAIGLFVRYVMPERRNRGVADVIEAAALKSGSITVREGLGAAAASAASISVGASVGREGPVVHLGARPVVFHRNPPPPGPVSGSHPAGMRRRLGRGRLLQRADCGSVLRA